MTISHYAHLFNRGLDILEKQGPGEFWKQLKVYTSSRGNIIQQLAPGRIRYVSCADLANWSIDWCNTTLPRDFDIVVGIPRGGLLVGAIIAQRLGKQLFTPTTIPFGTAGRVLLVDESALSGGTLSANSEYLKFRGFNVKTAALIVTPNVKGLPNYHYKVIPAPMVAEWELTDYKGAGFISVAYDMDGVLCQDCPPEVIGITHKYTNWVNTVRPLFIPTYEIDAIISNRLSSYLPQTVKWLNNNGVRYKRLYLRSNPNEEWTKHKIDTIRAVKPDIYYESDRNEAEAISKATRTPVLWFKGGVVF